MQDYASETPNAMKRCARLHLMITAPIEREKESKSDAGLLRQVGELPIGEMAITCLKWYLVTHRA